MNNEVETLAGLLNADANALSRSLSQSVVRLAARPTQGNSTGSVTKASRQNSAQPTTTILNVTALGTPYQMAEQLRRAYKDGGRGR